MVVEAAILVGALTVLFEPLPDVAETPEPIVDIDELPAGEAELPYAGTGRESVGLRAALALEFPPEAAATTDEVNVIVVVDTPDTVGAYT